MISSSSPSSTDQPRELPADWVDHPRVPITRRAVLAGCVILIFGVAGALGSAYFRRTRLGLTTEFLGANTIRALQSADRVVLYLEPIGASESTGQTIDLSGTPGLGHLRRALLDERHYDWSTEQARSVESFRSAETQLATLSFSDPTGQIPDATVSLELANGWVASPSADRVVQLTPRVQPAVRHFLVVISNAQQTYYDRRRQSQSENSPAATPSAKSPWVQAR